MKQMMFILLCLWMVVGMATTPRYPFDDLKQREQFQALLHDLRCPVCQNQDLADSNAGIAADLRQEVYRMVLAHASDREIIHYLTARYGEFIVFKPSLTLTTSVLWLGPLGFLVIGMIIFRVTCLRRPTKVEPS